MKMRKDLKVGFYVVLKALDRIANHVKSRGGSVDSAIAEQLEQFWLFLTTDDFDIKKSKKLDAKIGQLIIDEQDATTSQIELNFFLYALSDLFICVDQRYGEGSEIILESVGEYYFFYIDQRLISQTKNVEKLVTESSTTEVEQDREFTREIEQQDQDRAVANTIEDWSSVTRW